MGGANEINDLADAKYDGSSLFLGFGAGNEDDGNNSFGLTAEDVYNKIKLILSSNI
jgi:hypothetical protein